MAAQPPSTMSPRPSPPPAGSGPEPLNNARAVGVTVVAVALAIGLLAAIPGRKAVAAGSARHRGSHSVPTTTVPVSASSTTSTTAAASGVRVAVLAASGSPGVSATKNKLTAAHDTVVPESSIPYSWVSSMTSPLVEYPAGYESQAMQVATTLGVKSSAVTEESSGSGYGSNVVEVFLPPT